MPEQHSAIQTHTNPVHPFSFPDPYVLKFRGEYFAYCTGVAADGNVFGVLRSRDLVHWEETGGAMAPLAGAPPFYWAPEVTYARGKFYLYYSAGNEALMEIRVAVSDRPDGGFVDSGRRLTTEDFAIDPHVFTDDDGTRYIFYATDFLEHTHIGTGTVVDRMIDWFTLGGSPRAVTRAKYDWQVYDPVRKEKGGVRWHTVEGPFVLKRKGAYYEMFSGGNWKNVSYGVSFAVTGDIANDDEWKQNADGEKILPVLRTLPGKVIGPGHNSVVRGPNNRELFCIYHRWLGDERVLAIDRMDFAGNRIFVKGATHTPQPAPFKPAVNGFSGPSLETTGLWHLSELEARSARRDTNELIFFEPAPNYLFEVSSQNPEDANWNFGFYLADGNGKIFEFLSWRGLAESCSTGGENQMVILQGEFVPKTVQHLRVELDGRYLRLALNDTDLFIEKLLDRSPERFALTTGSMGTVFSGFSLTRGFEDLFDRSGEAGDRGWKTIRGTGTCHVENGEAVLTSRDETLLTKGPRYAAFEFAANIRLAKVFDKKYNYGFMILDRETDFTRIEIEPHRILVENRSFDLPDSFAPMNYHQFRIIKAGTTIYLQMEEYELATMPAPAGDAGVAIFCKNASVAVEMARLTNLY